MNYKILRRRCQRARKRSSTLCLDLALLSRMEVLTTWEKDRLASARKAAFKAMQHATRLQRRVAKLTGANFVPELMRSKFKKTSIFKRLLKTQGAEAAMSYLFGTTSDSQS